MKLAGKSPRMGRLPGKSANPEFTQITAYIRKETRRKVKIQLLQEEAKGRELSELIEDLLAAWLKKRTKKSVPSELVPK